VTRPFGLEDLSRDELARLVPEYLLAGHLIDRAGMPHLIGAFGRDVMRDIAIEEWMGASPVYTRRMQRALAFEGDSVEVIFKGMQFDIGAPPQFMDFRYELTDHDHGGFRLDHCGALMDVEPMGPEFVVAMCHDIEDPTFDATAIATNSRARVRPVHRPPRVPADRQPHCQWEVTISEHDDPLPVPPQAEAVQRTRAASLGLDPIDPADDGRHDYSGPLLADLRFTDWSSSALRRIAQEVALQGHLLVLSFMAATGERAGSRAGAVEFGRRQFTGVAGVVAARLHAALGLGHELEDAASLLSLHPAMLPAPYVQCTIERGHRLVVRFDPESAAQADGAWPSMLGTDRLDPLDAIVWAVDPHLRCVPLEGDHRGLAVQVIRGDHEAPLSDDVLVTRFSTGAEYAFAERGTPVEIGPRPLS
jgi:hypothetical protein